MMTTFDRETFAAVLGSPFTLTAEGGQTVDIELAEVSEWRETPANRSFSILFVVPEPYRVEQGLYDLENATLGTMQLFLVPVAMPNEPAQLEAVFNLLKEKEGGVSDSNG